MKRFLTGSREKSAIVNRLAAHLGGEFWRPRVRQPQEFVDQAELVHHLQRRGMDRVAAKIAQEIRVLLRDDDIDAGPRQQKAQHQPRRACTGNHTGRPNFTLFVHHPTSRKDNPLCKLHLVAAGPNSSPLL